MDGTPLPAALSGVTVQRLIEIDEALLYLVTGALAFAAIREPLEQTGALTPETARDALNSMIEVYLHEAVSMTPVGATMLWHMDTPPDRWLICDGGGYLKTDYPELFALFGAKYGDSPLYFGVPDLREKVPYGADFLIPLDATYGEAEHTLIVDEMPSHTHRVPKQSATVNAAVNVATPAARTDTTATPQIITDATGGGLPHNNIQPSYGVNFIVYAGRA